MATSEKRATELDTLPANDNIRLDSPNDERPSGWRYKNFKFGPFTIPWYASPEAQLLLVSFVCFLCPGKLIRVLEPAGY